MGKERAGRREGGHWPRRRMGVDHGLGERRPRRRGAGDAGRGGGDGTLLLSGLGGIAVGGWGSGGGAIGGLGSAVARLKVGTPVAARLVVRAPADAWLVTRLRGGAARI